MNSTYDGQHYGDDLIKSIAPSVFAKTAMPGVSDRYQFVPTIEVVRTMRAQGYEVVKASQSTTRKPDGGTYVKHCLRMQHSDYLAGDRRMVGDVVPQILLTNSHNRTSAFQLDIGLFRLQCSNGLAVCISNFGSYRVLHNDKQMKQHIIDGTNLVREVTTETVVPQIAAMVKKELTASQEQEFALAATFLKFGKPMESEVESFLRVQRESDAGRSLWSVLNRCQEAAVRGGYQTTSAGGATITRKPIASVGRELDFNKAIWALAGEVVAV